MKGDTRRLNVLSYEEYCKKQKKTDKMRQMTTVSTPFPAKRKRGRPRKDGNLSRESSLQSLENPKTQAIYPTLESFKKTQEFDRILMDESVDCMVGSVIYGVIEGSFDAGYFISVRIGSNGTPYRGVVFQPKKIVPITVVNDVAPQARMFERRQVSIPAYDDSNQMSGFSPNQEIPVVNHPVQAAKQAVFRSVSPSVPSSLDPYPLSNHSNFMFRSSSCFDFGQKMSSNPFGVDKQNLRMVEEDEVMQAFEVSSSSKGLNGNTTDMMMSDFLYREATNSLPDKQCLNPRPLTPNLLHNNEPTVSNLEQHVAPSVHEIQQDELISSEHDHPRKFTDSGLQSSEIQPQETPPFPQIQPYYNQLQAPEVDFHQSPFIAQSQHHSSRVAADYHPNLNLNLASSMKSPKMGYQQALVSGNPLLLPSDLIGEHLDYILEKSKSSPNPTAPQETNSEIQYEINRSSQTFGSIRNADVIGSPCSQYKLELATPQSASSTRHSKQTTSSGGCMGLDFVGGSSFTEPHQS